MLPKEASISRPSPDQPKILGGGIYNETGKKHGTIAALDRPVVSLQLAVMLSVGSPTTGYQDVSVGSLTLHRGCHFHLPARLSYTQRVNTSSPYTVF